MLLRTASNSLGAFVMKGSSLTVDALSHQSDVYLQSVRCKSVAYINYSELYVDLTCYNTSL
jgi:hypothetical protein